MTPQQARRRWIRPLAAGMASMLPLLMLPTAGGADVTDSGTITLVNTDPLTPTGGMSGGQLSDGVPDFTSLDAMIDLIDNTPSGASIRAAFYELQHVENHDMVATLGSAAQRGVDVRIIIDHKVDATGANRNDAAIAELSGAPYNIPITACDTACNGSNGIAHNKFFLFTETVDQSGTSRTNVVANGSQNITDQQNTVHNNFLISYDDPIMYAGFLDYWEAMNNQVATAANPAVSTPVGSSTGHITTYFFPRAPHDDPIVDFVNQLDCSRGGQIVGQSATWTSDRTALNEALMAQADAGCQIELLMDHSNAPLINDGSSQHENELPSGTNVFMNANIFALHGIKVYGITPGGCRYIDHPSRKTNCHGADGGTHEKFLIVQGQTASGDPVNEVISGAENFTGRALTVYTDSTQVITDPLIVQAFLDDYTRQKSKAIAIHPTKYPEATFAPANSASAGSQDRPEVARTGDYTAVVWADTHNPTEASAGNHGAIYLKLTHAGTTVYEVPVQAQSSAFSGSDYKHPDLAIDAWGNVAVVWADDDDGNGSYNVVMRRVTNDGTASPAIGPRVRVHADTSFDQTAPSIAMTPAGDVSVAWTDSSTGNTQIRLSTFSSTGTKVNEQQVNATTTGSHTQPTVAAYPSAGGAWVSVVAWRDDSDGNDFGDIHGRALSSTGAEVWADQRLQSRSAGDQSVPEVSANASGVVAVWQTHHANGTPCRTYDSLAGGNNDPAFPPTGTERCVEVREFDATGIASDPEFEVSKGLFETGAYASYTQIGEQRAPTVALTDDGDYVVAWQELTPHRNGWDIYARSFTPGGGSSAFTLPEYLMNPIIPHDQVNPSVATDSAGNFVLVYNDDNDGNGSTEIHQRDGFTTG